MIAMRTLTGIQGALASRLSETGGSRVCGRRTLVGLAVALSCLELLHRFVSLAAGQAPLHHDKLGYWTLAQQMASGDWFLLEAPTAFRAPLYPAFLAVWQLLFGDRALVATVVSQHALGTLATLAVAAAAWLLTSRPAAFVTAQLLSMGALGAVQYANQVLSESLFAFAIAVHVLAIAWWHRAPSAARATLLGATLALTALIRPTTTHLWLIEAAVLLFAASREGARGPRRFAQPFAHVAACLLVLVPWLIRNEVAFGKPFLTAALGRCVWHCYFDERGAALPLPPGEPSRLLEGVPFRETFLVHGALTSLGLDEVESDRWMARVTARAVLAHPGAAIRTAARNWAAYWYSVEEAFPWYPRIHHSAWSTYLDQRPWQLPTQPLDGLFLFAYRYSRTLSAAWSVLSLAACLVLITHARLRPVGLILLGSLIYFATVSSVVILPLYRLRIPTLPIMVVALAAGGVLLAQASASRVWSRSRPRLAPASLGETAD